MIVDGVAYSTGTIRQLVRERHDLADQNRVLAGRVRLLRHQVERQQIHLQYRTAALVRLIAASRPRLDAPEGASPIARKGPVL